MIKQISSLEKVRDNSVLNYDEICKKTMLKGERFAYQIAVKSDERINGVIEVKSEIADCVKIYSVLNAVMDKPITESEAYNDINYITKEPGLMPDILKPIEEKNNILLAWNSAVSLWIEIDIPENMDAGDYNVEILCKDIESNEVIFSKKMQIEVIEKKILPQSLIYTRWFYVDCIADYHGVEVYSKEHWALIEEYIKQAADVGINMLLVPIHTPPLDTAIGTERTCVQLVDIEKKGDEYIFDFTKFRRYIDICKKYGIKYFEMAHMFSQWGAKCAPNIYVKENGELRHMFGWHVAADSEEYVLFLKQYIAAISKSLKEENISKNTYFHISDEPVMENIETYKRAYEIIKPLIGDSKTFDALSDFEFYEQKLVECPVTSVSHIKTFLEHDIENQWAYYCCGPQSVYVNSTLAMPSDRVRMLGILLYKYDIKGFLHWGLNFYNGQISRYHINPYVTTSSDGRFPSGDPFILYPSNNGAYGCIRGKVTKEGICDMDICRTLEQYIGREAVVKMIDDEAGFEVTFDNYPADKKYLLNLREKMTELIKNS